MNFTLFKYYFKDFQGNEKKLSLITFAIAWGSLCLLLLMAFGRGMSNQFSKGISGLGKNLLIIGGGQTSITYKGLPEGRRISLIPDDVNLLRESIPEIENVSAENNYYLSVKYKKKLSTKNINGVFNNFMVVRTTYPVWGGRFINDDDNRLKRRVAFLGWKVAKDLFKDENPIGKELLIKGVPFKVIGIMKKKLQMGNYNGFTYNQIYVPFNTVYSMMGRKRVSRIHIQTKSKKLSEIVQKKLRIVLGKKHGFSKDDKRAVWIWDTIKNAEINRKVFLGLEIFLFIVGSFTLFVSAIGVSNLMYALIKQKTREIGVKKALGANKWQIVMQFIFQGALVFFRGVFWGGVIAFNIVGVVRLIPVSYDISKGMLIYFLRPVFSFNILIVFMFTIGILILTSTLFPALKASKMNVVDALRYE